MIAVDTNILVRYFVDDDPAQSALARRLIEEELTPDRPGLVTVVALVELAWVLRSGYGITAPAVMEAVRKLLSASQLIVEDANSVEAALAQSHSDLADNLIHQFGRVNGCDYTITFDQRFARLDGVELLA